jgi:hypothetical protein
MRARLVPTYAEKVVVHVAPPFVERCRPASVAARTSLALPGFTERSKNFTAETETGSDQVAPASVDLMKPMPSIAPVP